LIRGRASVAALEADAGRLDGVART
jgi:hypothetical protein